MDKIIQSGIGEILLSTDRNKLNIDVLYGFLSKEAYWSIGKPKEVIEKSVEGSFNLGVYFENCQIAYARVITDYITFAYLCDVFVLAEFRGKGISKIMMEELLANPELKNIRKWVLATDTASGLYKKYGFTNLTKPEMYMQFINEDAYTLEKER